MHSPFPLRPILASFLFAGATAAPLLAQTRVAARSEVAGSRNDGKPFEEVCTGRMVGIAVRTALNGRHIGMFAVGDTGQHIVAVAPICESLDGVRSDLAWHGGT